ncbi:MAG TPA: alpha-galactosidase [Chthonomonadales bacterium]|nr:alpha-galactosidase [Chthonomonadales bacterium]
MPKIAFVGAGSLGFTRGLVRDILTFPALADSTISLMDIDEERLSFAETAVKRIVAAGGYPARVEATLDRRRALDGADAVLCTILAAPVQVWRHDIEIPKRFGVDTNVGDTRGPSGVFRALRTIPVMLSICRDMEQVCPRAVLLNYTNPMAMLCRAILRETSVLASGLCHSVQGTAAMLARWIGAPMDEITFVCAGINHLAFFTEYKWKGEDAYPHLREAVRRPEVYNEEIVRNEMFLHLDYYVTESSGHNSEYSAWFRKRPDLIERYCTHGTGWNPGRYAYILDGYLQREDTWRDEARQWLSDETTIDLRRGHEYAASIINAVAGDGDLFEFNGNVLNKGLIDNLPPDCCVEVPVVASRRGLDAIHVGPLPASVTPLVSTSALIEELAVEAAITGNPRLAFQSVAYDPLTSAVLSLAEIKEMVAAMLAVNEPYLPQFRSIAI